MHENHDCKAEIIMKPGTSQSHQGGIEEELKQVCSARSCQNTFSVLKKDASKICS